jgi:hypothetical protein
MISLLVLKRYELNSGRVLLGSARPAVGNFFHLGLSWLEYVLPGLLRVGMRTMYNTARRVWHVWASRLAAQAERGLERALRRVRRSAAGPRPGGYQSSAFLRQVTEHKKRLQDDQPGQGLVIEE